MTADKYIKNYIDGALAPAIGQYLDNSNPAGKVYSHLPTRIKQDVQRAVEAAERAYREWSMAEPARGFCC